jgi:isocitrate dehydrogenase
MDSSIRYAKVDEAPARCSNETSTTVSTQDAGPCRIEVVGEDGLASDLQENPARLEGEAIDGRVLGKRALLAFLKKQVEDADDQGVLYSARVKVTMMKVSDPITFDHVVSVCFEDVFEKYAETFRALGISANNGPGDLLAKLEGHPQYAEIQADINACCARRPELAAYWVQVLAEQADETGF